MNSIMLRANCNSYRNTLKTNSETVKISRAICTTLDRQSGQLNTFENNVYITDQMVKQSNHIVRGMTWFGWLINKFVSKPVVDAEYQKNMSISDILSHKPKPFMNPIDFSKANFLEMNKINHSNTASNEETEFLNELSSQLSELKQTSKMIGECLDKQLNQIDDIETKLFKTQMNMKKLSIKIDNF